MPLCMLCRPAVLEAGEARRAQQLLQWHLHRQRDAAPGQVRPPLITCECHWCLTIVDSALMQHGELSQLHPMLGTLMLDVMQSAALLLDPDIQGLLCPSCGCTARSQPQPGLHKLWSLKQDLGLTEP